ncbi:MAG: hypothetical protein ABFS35_18025 [Bacteroidota bacterium]
MGYGTCCLLCFKKGHRIRLIIAGGDIGNFEINPTWFNEDGTEKEDICLRIYIRKSKTSCIILPFVD